MPILSEFCIVTRNRRLQTATGVEEAVLVNDFLWVKYFILPYEVSNDTVDLALQ